MFWVLVMSLVAQPGELVLVRLYDNFYLASPSFNRLRSDYTRANIYFSTVTQAFNQHHFMDDLPTLNPLATALFHTIAHLRIYHLDTGYQQ